jgi:hypothetical protein
MSRPEASLAIGRGLGRLRACPVSHKLREASVGNERTFVGLDVHARSVIGHALDAVTGEVCRTSNPEIEEGVLETDDIVGDDRWTGRQRHRAV